MTSLLFTVPCSAQCQYILLFYRSIILLFTGASLLVGTTFLCLDGQYVMQIYLVQRSYLVYSLLPVRECLHWARLNFQHSLYCTSIDFASSKELRCTCTSRFTATTLTSLTSCTLHILNCLMLGWHSSPLTLLFGTAASTQHLMALAISTVRWINKCHVYRTTFYQNIFCRIPWGILCPDCFASRRGPSLDQHCTCWWYLWPANLLLCSRTPHNCVGSTGEAWVGMGFLAGDQKSTFDFSIYYCSKSYCIVEDLST